ncbi:MAG: AraC family transcriptional regulator [Polyangiaceae bacterium]
MDSLSTILDSVRLASTAISCATFGAPWAVRTVGAPAGIFHAILEGSAWITAEGSAGPVLLRQGDVVVLPSGAGHTIGDAAGTAPVAIGDLETRAGQNGVAMLRHGGKGAETRIFCGTFHLEHDAERSLLSLLPGFMHVPAERSAAGEPTAATLKLLDHEVRRDAPGSRALVLRLCDVLFVQVLREHISSSPAGARGWLAALRDEHVGRALALIHESPGERWDARSLAARSGTSRSRLFARFTELVGEPPARYVARWRILTAADLLGRRRASVADVAEQVGYASEDAFVKAFKRHLGHSPSEYRRKLSSRGDAVSV